MKPVILIVEDEPAIADTIQYALETDGFATRRLETGGEVPALLDRETIDLVVLDVGLPDVSGFEVCKTIRAVRAVPVIFLTARADEIDRVVGLEIGADDYVTKPFSPRELAARVKAVLRRAGPAEGGRAADCVVFTVDAGRRRISYLGRVLSLSRYEYELLATFIRRPGHVFSRDRLMDMVWDEPGTVTDRTVDAHIKNLRAKLRAVNPDADPIVTHRGVGYSLVEGPGR